MSGTGLGPQQESPATLEMGVIEAVPQGRRHRSLNGPQHRRLAQQSSKGLLPACGTWLSRLGGLGAAVSVVLRRSGREPEGANVPVQPEVPRWDPA